MIDAIINFLFPPKCPFCGKLLTHKSSVCSDCLKTLPFIKDNACIICGRELEEFSHCICAHCRGHKIYYEHSFVPLIYKDSARKAALSLKSGHPYFAKGFAYLLADKILSSPYYTDFDCITFVPQSPRSKRSRGYNQAELIAKELSKLMHVPCVSTLKRSNSGAPQHTLNAQQRQENVKKCYFKKADRGSGTVLLVDDIYTTGATANYCSKLLLQTGYKKVYCAIAMIAD